MTNVPGPREPVYLAGTAVRSVLVWAPTSGHIGMSVSSFSYPGEVTIGLMVDAGLIPDPGQIVTQLEREITMRKLISNSAVAVLALALASVALAAFSQSAPSR